MLGALGGFFLPLIFGAAYARTGIPQTTFMVLFLLVAVSFAWLHLTVMSLKRQAMLERQGQFDFTEPMPTITAGPPSA
jgi:NNP family nitrate/nitrite transporter-like MFS transporter